MNTARAATGKPKPRSLHTDDEVHAIAETPPGRRVANAHWCGFLAVLSIAADYMGGPVSLFARGVMAADMRRQALRFLRVLETMLRRILIILAANDTRPLKPACPNAPHPAQPSAARAPDNPPIYFAMTPPAASEPALRAWTRALPRRDADWATDAIARRLEAAIRVYMDTDADVLRLRRRLAWAEGRRANQIFTRILITPVGPWLPEIAAIMAEACGDAYQAIKTLTERPPPIVGA